MGNAGIVLGVDGAHAQELFRWREAAALGSAGRNYRHFAVRTCTNCGRGTVPRDIILSPDGDTWQCFECYQTHQYAILEREFHGEHANAIEVETEDSEIEDVDDFEPYPLPRGALGFRDPVSSPRRYVSPEGVVSPPDRWNGHRGNNAIIRFFVLNIDAEALAAEVVRRRANWDRRRVAEVEYDPIFTPTSPFHPAELGW
jgi:hypothetical protein